MYVLPIDDFHFFRAMIVRERICTWTYSMTEDYLQEPDLCSDIIALKQKEVYLVPVRQQGNTT